MELFKPKIYPFCSCVLLKRLSFLSTRTPLWTCLTLPGVTGRSWGNNTLIVTGIGKFSFGHGCQIRSIFLSALRCFLKSFTVTWFQWCAWQARPWWGKFYTFPPLFLLFPQLLHFSSTFPPISSTFTLFLQSTPFMYNLTKPPFSTAPS